jgi:hypothetical protein
MWINWKAKTRTATCIEQVAVCISNLASLLISLSKHLELLAV